MEDKIITCVQCNDSFVFHAKDRQRFISLGFDEPTRCPHCRKNKFKHPKSEDPWKNKGRKKHSRRKNSRDYDDAI